jgi:hypothetical protein
MRRKRLDSIGGGTGNVRRIVLASIKGREGQET